jgi:hypothetical protein
MKVLLYNDLFYYTTVTVMYTNMQELMWAAECFTLAICDHQRWLWLELIQPVVSSARSCMCTVCTVAKLAHEISCCAVI